MSIRFCARLVLGMAAACLPLRAVAEEAAASDPTEETSALSIADVTRMSAAGLGDDVIVAKIEASGVIFDLEVDEILHLKREGVSDRVLAALVRTGVIQKHYATKRAREEAAERHAISRPVIVERYAPDVYVAPRYRWYPRVGFGVGYGYPWYGTYYTSPWYWGSGYYFGGGGHHGGHWGGHHGSYHHSGTQSGGTNHHGGHKPVLGTRNVGGRGGRR